MEEWNDGLMEYWGIGNLGNQEIRNLGTFY
jgi:hypothetical protein